MNRITRFIIIFLLLSLSFNVMSQDMSAIKKMMHTQMMAFCNDPAFMNCIGISEKKCTSATTKTISKCDHLFPKSMNDNAMDVYNECVSNNLLKNADINSDKLENCEPTINAAPQIDQSQMLEMVSEAVKQHAQSIGTADVTLPLYKNATVIGHATAEMRTQMFGKEALAMVSLDSTDSPSQIASFYRGKLKGFTEHKVENGILFLKGSSKNFDILRNFNTMLVTPNIFISSIPDSSIRIDVTYNK